MNDTVPAVACPEYPAQQINMLGPVQIRQLCDTLGIRPTKTLGQNFVHDAGTVRKITKEANVTPGESVLEIGPGLGSLTLALLEAGARVTAVEIDPKLAAALPATAARQGLQDTSRLHVINADALHITGPEFLQPSSSGTISAPSGPLPDGGSCPAPSKLVANLPYNLAVPILLTLLENLPSLQEVLVMVQAEVADRLAAPPGSRTYGVPSVKAAWYGQVNRSLTISRHVFYPVPNVDSALVRLRKTAPPVTSALKEDVFTLVDVAFSQRRKTLRAALASFSGSGPAAEAALQAAGIDPGLRGERLNIIDFARLAEAYAQVVPQTPPVVKAPPQPTPNENQPGHPAQPSSQATPAPPPSAQKITPGSQA